MADVALTGARKAFGPVDVLKGIDLAIADGEFVVFVGPSGCGKSTLLRVIAGLEDLTSGEIRIGGRVVNHLPPADRGIAMVFQSYALYPHMNLYDNLAFSLKLAGRPRAEIDEAVARAAKILGIDHLLDRKPRALSGGQRQRVAIGRAIVREPEVFLFDEPLSNLDAALRVKMRYEFAALHKQLGTTMIYVTHDQVEAMTLADRIVVLNEGAIEQVGAPMALYENPANVFVATFIGSPKMNLIEGMIEAVATEGIVVRMGSGARLTAAVEPAGATPGDPVRIGIRPEHVSMGEGNRLTASVRFVETLGGLAYAYLDHGGLEEPLTWQLTGTPVPVAGDTVDIALPAERLYLFDADGDAFPRRKSAPERHAA